MYTLRPNPTALLNPCADPIFKSLFTQETKESRNALTSFLSAIFEKPVTNVELRQNELPIDTLGDRQTRFDITCLVDGHPVNIEMQGKDCENSFNARAEYHAAHLFNHFVKSGQQWDEMPQVFQISVLGYVYENDEKGVHHYRMRTNDGKNLGDRLNVIFIELPKFDDTSCKVENLTRLERWCKFFLYANKPDKIGFVASLVTAEDGIMDAHVTIQKLSAEEMEWKRQFDHFVMETDRNTMLKHADEKGFERGYDNGFSTGFSDGKLEGYKNLIKSGFVTAEQVSKEYDIPLEKLV